MLIRADFNHRNDNIGDQAIYLALVHALAKHTRVFISGKRPSFLTGDKIEDGTWRWRFNCLSARVRGERVIRFLAPGGYGGTLKPAPPSITISSKLKKLIGTWMNGETVQLGSSAKPGSDFARWKNAAWIGVRDQVSVDALRQAGLPNFGYFPDLAFLFPVNSIQSPKDDRQSIGFTFRQELPETPSRYSAASAITKTLDRFFAKESISDLCWYHQVDEDRDYIEQLHERFGGELHNAALSLSSFPEFYNKRRFVVSNRLHALLLAGLCGTVPIALTTRSHQKLVSVFETVGLNELVVDVDEADAAERLTELMNNHTRYTGLVTRIFDEQRALGTRLLAEILERISHGR